MGKGMVSDRNPNALGVVGFMRHDYENFAFDQADVILSVGYELQEFAPVRINPHKDKKIIHVHCFAEDTDACYPISVSLEADIGASLAVLQAAFAHAPLPQRSNDAKIRQLRDDELARGAKDDSFPLKRSASSATCARPWATRTSCWPTPAPSRCGWHGSTPPMRR